MCDILLFTHPIFHEIEFLNFFVLNLTLNTENSYQQPNYCPQIYNLNHRHLMLGHHGWPALPLEFVQHAHTKDAL